MHRLLRHIVPGLEEHLTDSRLGSLLCDELSFMDRWIARAHVARCWKCKFRMQNLEEQRAPQILDRYRDAVLNEMPALREGPELEFARKLRLSLDAEVPPKQKAFRLPKITLPELPPMNPAFVTCMVFAFATVLSFHFWWHQRTPQISSNALLVRAEKWDTPNLATTSSVVYQAVRITVSDTSRKETVSRSIYRDTQGKRKPKQVKLNTTEEQLRATLTEAGLDWDEPLSASGYQHWHDQQHVREDHITRAGAHLLQLTTIVPEGTVAEQSLTVRDTDFHPVQRTLALRNAGTVEIAEVDFKILPWSAVDANAFEPLESSALLTSSPARVLTFPRLPEVLTDAQLDEAELGAKLILNQLHADSGQQIEVVHTPQGVEVKGLVETNELKRSLQAQLRIVPHLSVSIQSVEDLKNHPELAKDDSIGPIKMESMPSEASPLATHLLAGGASVEGINALARQLFESALSVTQESKAIVDLQTRFTSDEPRSLITTTTLSDLLYSHRERLKAALKREQELLGKAQGSPVVLDKTDESRYPLLEAANRNLALCRELTQNGNSSMRSAESIFADITDSMKSLTSDIRNSYAKDDSARSPTNGRK